MFWHFGLDDLERTALVLDGGARLTYGQLDQMAEHWRSRIIEAEAAVGPAVVALEFERSAEAIAAYLGALRAGVPVLPGEPGKLGPDSRIRQVWAPEIVIRRRDGVLDLAVAAPGAGPGTRPAPHPDLALLLSTSGSTGDPKLVRLSMGNIQSNSVAIADYLDVRPDDCAATTLPLFYSYGLSVLNSYLQAGAALHLTSLSVSDGAFWDDARAAGVTSLALVPHQCEVLDHEGLPGARLPTLRYVTQAGGRLAPAVVRRPAAAGSEQGWRFVVMYGQTEAAPRMAYVPPEALPGAADTIGRAIPGGRLWIADPEGRPISGPGRAGELVYDGPNVMMGYAQARGDLARGAELTELRTGDMAERTEDGLFRIVGRIGRFVKLFGNRLNLDQIELDLAGAGHAVQAVAVEDRLVLLHGGSGPGPAEDRGPEIAGLVADAYGLPMAEVHAAPLERLPLLPSGKTDRRALEHLARAALAEHDAAAARAGGDIGTVIREATRVRQLSRTDTYRSLGGDSLGHLRVLMALERQAGAVPDGWETWPIHRLEAYVRGAGAVDRARPVRVGGDVVLRLCAVALVVVQHATDYALEGGTWVLLMLMGFMAARFQAQNIVGGRPGRIVSTMLYPVLPLYAGVVLAFAVLVEPISPSYFTLTRNYDPLAPVQVIGVFWFVALYVQVVGLLAGVAAAPGVGRVLGRRPWDAAVWAMVGALALAGLVCAVSPVTWITMFGAPRMLIDLPVPHIPEQGLVECLPVFLAGWVLAVAERPGQRAVALGLGALMVGQFAWIASYGSTPWVLGAGMVLLWARVDVPMPRRMARVVRRLASVSLFVYLTHMGLVYLLVNLLHGHDRVGQPVTALAVLAGSFAVALVLEAAFARVETAVRRPWRPSRLLAGRT